jgi:pimeloyl-ACP methyl ester carboxylesterase
MPATLPPPQPEEPPSFLTRSDGAALAYRRRPGKAPGVVFLGGFMSDMTGIKARTLDAFCAARGHAYLRFDYFAHGASAGDFASATVGRWREDARVAFDALTEGPQILVGSSLGGWIMLLLALARPERVRALVGIAAAPDATEALMWRRFPETVRQEILAAGAARLPSQYGGGYLFTRTLIEEGRRHLIMDGPIAIDRPLRLLHGMEDPDVPWNVSLDLARQVTSRDVQVTLVKDGDHRLSRDQDLLLLLDTVARLIDG